MATLAVGWWPVTDDEMVWQARMDPGPESGRVHQLQLTAYERRRGLWNAAVDCGPDSRQSPSPFTNRELAQDWAEAQAAQIAGVL